MNAPGEARGLIPRALACIKANDNVRAKSLLLDILAQRQSDAEAWYYLGVVHLRLDEMPDAERCLRRAIALKPELDLAHYWLGVALTYLGRSADGAGCFERAIALNPGHRDAHVRAARLYAEVGDLASAERHAQAAIGSHPADADAHACLGMVLHHAGRTNEAEAAYRRASEIAPSNLRAALGSHLSLPIVYRDRDELLASRRHYDEGLDLLAAGAARFERGGGRHDLLWNDGFYLAYQGMNDRDLQARFGRFYRGLVRAASPAFMEPVAPRPASNRRIRVAYLCHFLHHHTVSWYFRSWLEHADRDRFEITLYHLDPKPDAVSAALSKACDCYVPITGSISSVARRVRNDAQDILVYLEIGMYPRHLWFASMRLAPVQCAAWGHPDTTGLESIDYYLSADATEPANGQDHYSERLVRLPGMGVSVAPTVVPERAARAEHGLPEDRRIYLCAQSLFKIHPDTDALLAGVAARDPTALIVLFVDGRQALDEIFRGRIDKVFRAAGLDPSAHLCIRPRLSYAEFLRLCTAADVMLDPPHWSGGRTSFDALGCGLPVVTITGELSRGRQTAAMLGVIGQPELAVATPEQYVEVATTVASSLERNRNLGEEIRRRARGTLFDAPSPSRGVEDFYRDAVGGSMAAIGDRARD
jgi:CRISPR-associated protein Csy1